MFILVPMMVCLGGAALMTPSPPTPGRRVRRPYGHVGDPWRTHGGGRAPALHSPRPDPWIPAFAGMDPFVAVTSFSYESGKWVHLQFFARL